MLSNIEVLELNLSSKVIVFIVKLLEATLVGKVFNFLIGTDKDFSLSHGQVKGEVTIGLEIVMLDSASKELVGLILHLVKVGQLELAHGESCRHAELPLDFIYNTVSKYS